MIRKKHEVDLPHGISDDIFKSVGFSIVKKSAEKIVATIPTRFTVDGIRLYKELSLPCDAKNTDSIFLTVFNETVPLSKIYACIDLNLNDTGDLITVLNEVKHARLCSGSDVDQEDSDFMWNCEENDDKQKMPKKRSSTCSLLLRPDTLSAACMNCRWLASKYRQTIREQKDEEEERDKLSEWLEVLMQDHRLTKRQKKALNSQLEEAKLQHYQWDKNIIEWCISIYASSRDAKRIVGNFIKSAA